MKVIALTTALLVLALVITAFLAARRWDQTTNEVVARLTNRVDQSVPRTFTLHDLDGLPTPVARSFRTVLRDGQRHIREARLAQHGEFLLRPPTEWSPFAAVEVFTANPPGFVQDARIRMMPGVNVFVRDAFIDGAGVMWGSVGGLIPVVNMQGAREITAGALHRYLAEAVWFPTALLPGHGVVWTAIDDSTVRATLTVSSTSVWLDFYFGADGLISRVYTPSRYREVNGQFVPTPWQGRFHRYESRDGVIIPLAGEVEWLLPEGPQMYWRGEVTQVTFTP